MTLLNLRRLHDKVGKAWGTDSSLNLTSTSSYLNAFRHMP